MFVRTDRVALRSEKVLSKIGRGNYGMEERYEGGVLPLYLSDRDR